MRTSRWLAGGVAAAGLVAGAVALPRGAPAQDAGPSIAGSWRGTAKSKATSLDPQQGTETRKSPFTAEMSGSGGGFTMLLDTGDGSPLSLAGVEGNGTFWAASTDSPLILVGHANGKATRLKGSLLQCEEATAIDGTFQGVRETSR